MMSEMSSRFINKAMKELGSPAELEEVTELEFFNQEKAVFNLNCLYRSSAEVIGKGKLGITYKVTIESGLVVIVKRMRNMSRVSRKEFVQQLQLFGRLRHENIAEIISYHYSKEEKLIIYEHIPGASLFQLLHGKSLNLFLSFSRHTELVGGSEWMFDLAFGTFFVREVEVRCLAKF